MVIAYTFISSVYIPLFTIAFTAATANVIGRKLDTQRIPLGIPSKGHMAPVYNIHP